MAISKITTSGVSADTLTAADLAPNSVDSSELVDGAVDLSHMSANSVDSDQFVDGSIDTAHIGDDQVTGAKIENNPTIAGNLTVTGDIVPSSPLSHRNMIINGAMTVSQRGTSFTGDHGGSGAYTIDRWKAWQAGGGDITIEQSTEVPEGFTGGRSIKGTVTTADASIAGGDYYSISQYIEGQNIVGTDFGESTAKTLTLSFYVKTSVVGTYGGAVRNNAGNKIYPFQFVVANTNWNRYAITITGATDGTWLYTNALGLSCWWGLGTGTTYTDTAGSWTTKSGCISADSSLNWIATNGATYHLTGVQLELGSNATPFEHRSYGDELARCQRYFQRVEQAGAWGSGVGKVRNAGIGSTSGSAFTNFQFLQEMRRTPDIEIPTRGQAVGNIAYLTGEGYPSTHGQTVSTQGSTFSCWIYLSGYSQIGDSTSAATWAYTNGTAIFKFDAEL